MFSQVIEIECQCTSIKRVIGCVKSPNRNILWSHLFSGRSRSKLFMFYANFSAYREETSFISIAFYLLTVNSCSPLQLQIIMFHKELHFNISIIASCSSWLVQFSQIFNDLNSSYFIQNFLIFRYFDLTIDSLTKPNIYNQKLSWWSCCSLSLRLVPTPFNFDDLLLQKSNSFNFIGFH